MYDPSMIDLDVDAILSAFLRGARRGGVELRCDADLRSISFAQGLWRLELAGDEMCCDTLVNAAGAWSDAVGERAGVGALGIAPKRRTAIIVPAPAGMEVAEWPMVVDAGETWYVEARGRPPLVLARRRDAVRARATRSPTSWTLRSAWIASRRRSTCRSAASRAGGQACAASLPDRTPVNGFDPRAEGFFWLAGQGGYGIQTAPAMAALAAALITGEPPPAELAAAGVAAADLSPARLVRA